MSGWKTLPFILITIVIIYSAALFVEKRQNKCTGQLKELTEDAPPDAKKVLKAKNTRDKRLIISAAMVLVFGLLIYFKYLNVILSNIYGLFGDGNFEPIKLIVPLGISFYTFQSVGYLIDVYRGKVKAEHNILRFGLFISYFPQIIQGPISRYNELADQLYAPHTFDFKRFKFGLQRMLWGYFQKLVIADRLALIVNEVFDNYQAKGYSGFVIFVAVFLYSIQIYCDFCGGMDIISGLSEAMGIDLPLNFRQPFNAHSVAEFWKRWHITLGAWLRNYLFYPLALSKPFTKMSKFLRKHVGNYVGKILPTCLASFITFFLIGIWHGANWKYVFYGFYQAMFVSTATLLEPFYDKCRNALHIKKDSKWFMAFQTVRTVLIVTIGRYFSRADSFTQAADMLKKTFTSWNPQVFVNGTFLNIAHNANVDTLNVILIVVLILFLFAVDQVREHGIGIRETIAKKNVFIRFAIYIIGIFAILLFGIYGPGVTGGNFIYQGF